MGNVSSHQQAPDADGAADTAANGTNDLLPNSDRLGSSCQIADHEDGANAKHPSLCHCDPLMWKFQKGP